MPGNLYGADIEALRLLAESIAQGSQKLDTVLTTIESSLPDADAWNGPDAEQFRGDWTSTHAPALRDASQTVMEASEAARRNADDQESTSEGGVEAAGPLPMPAGPTGNGSDNGAPNQTPIDSGGNFGDPEQIDPPADLSEEEFNSRNISQGQIGDCSLLSSLAAVAHSDPEFVQEHISYDAETGNYTVTLYEDGEPVDVVVDSTALSGQARDADGNYSWATIYEKAVAAHLGGDMENINGVWPHDMMPLITGEDADQNSHDDSGWNPFDGAPSSDDIRDSVENGRPVVALTPDDLDHDEIGANHYYVVDHVKDDGSIVLLNPWGPDDANHTVTVSESEYQDIFEHTATGEMP